MWFCGSIFEKLLFPFDKIDFRKKGSASSWSTDSPDMTSWMKMNGTSTVKEWLSIDQMAELFQRDKSTISRHIKNIFEEGELQRNSVVANFATTASDGKTYQVDYYNLDVIISVGYRVKSHRGTQFRIWAMGILKEYMKKGFALDDDRLKRLGGGNYFDELLARIRDIRSSEKVFWRKVLEIYATSIDYDPHAESSVLFFKQVQNKMYWAAHKHTAAEVIYERANAEKENMELTSWEHNEIRRSDVEVAKNYLTEQELDALNKIVTAYLDIAEVHALNKEPMYMKDWLEPLTIISFLLHILTHNTRRTRQFPHPQTLP